MKNTFFISRKMANNIIALVSVCSVVFGGMIIISLIDHDLFTAAIFAFFVVLSLAMYNSFKDKGVFDRIKITAEGIAVFRGFKKQIVSIPWENVINIQKIENPYYKVLQIESNILYENKVCILHTEIKDKIINLINVYYPNGSNDKPEIQSDKSINKKPYDRKIVPYRGKEVFDVLPKGVKTVLAMIFVLIPLIIMLFVCFSVTSDNYSGNPLGSIFVILMLIVILIIFMRTLYRKVFINEDGIKYVNKGNNKTIFFKWDEIKVIGISVYPFGIYPSSNFLYFTTVDIQDDLPVLSYSEIPNVILLKYRPEIVHCVLNYWNKEIRNLDSQESWQKYIDQL